jgi:hypothetical protein
VARGLLARVGIKNRKMQMGRDVSCRSDWLGRNFIGGQPRQRKPPVIEKLNFYSVTSDGGAKVSVRRQTVANLFRFDGPYWRALRERLIRLSLRNRQQARPNAEENEEKFTLSISLQLRTHH